MKRGFTLIELLVVIAIIAILAAILFPVFGKAREKARQTHCTNNQKSFATAVQIYTQEHDETFPKVETFWGDIRVDKAALKCMTIPSLPNGYVYNNSLSGKGVGEIPDPTNPAKIASADNLTLTADGITKQLNGLVNILYTDKDVDMRHNDKCIAAYADGHVEMSTASALRGIEVGLMPPGPMNASYNTATPFGATNGPMCTWVVTYDADGTGPGAEVPVTANEISPFPLANAANPSYTFKKFGVYKVTGTSTSMAANTSTWDVTIIVPWGTDTTMVNGLGLWFSADTAPSTTADGAALTSWPVSYPNTGVTLTSTGTATKYNKTYRNSKPAIHFTNDVGPLMSNYGPLIGASTFLFVADWSTGSWEAMITKGGYNNSGTDHVWFANRDSSESTIRRLTLSSDGWSYNHTGGNTINVPRDVNQHLYVRRYGISTAPNTWTIDGSVDGTALTPVNSWDVTSSQNTHPFFFGGASNGSTGIKAGQTPDGNLAEVIIYTRRLSDAEMKSAYNYLAVKYNFTPMP